MRFRGLIIPATWAGTALWALGLAVIVPLTIAWESPWFVCLAAGVAWAWTIESWERGR